MPVRKLILSCVMALLLISAALPARAQTASVYIRFFESIDVTLTDRNFQIFAVFLESGERLTVVAYGLEEDVAPGLQLLDPLGSIVAEDVNPTNAQGVFFQTDAQVTGMYTFIVSRQTEGQGFLRVMAFEGDPLIEDQTLLDTLDPLAPSRAFIIGSLPEDAVNVSVDVLEPDDETHILPEVFASRGRPQQLGPINERTTAIPEGELRSWSNDDLIEFFTLSIRPFPEIVPTASTIRGAFKPLQQLFDVTEYLILIGDGGPIEEVNRNICLAGGFEVVAVVPTPQATSIWWWTKPRSAAFR
ncbi:MAG: hypothetical protein HC915_19265 [Anaerolineae bacterium]|nr:hypothetical protein [Anaerolineae bacterium]